METHEDDHKPPPPEDGKERPHHLQELLEQEEEEEEKREEQEEEFEHQQQRCPLQNDDASSSSSPSPSPLHSSPPSPLHSSPPSPLHSSPPHSSDHHTSHPYGYVFSPPHLTQAKYQFPPPDQTSQSYVFSSSLAKSPSPQPEPHHTLSSKTPDEETVPKPVELGVPASGSSSRKPTFSVSEREKENIKKKALFGFRFLALVFCLVSFSVMAVDKNQGWALDSFYSYTELRYCISVNILGFVYSGLQAYDLAYSLATGKNLGRNQLRYIMDFSIDQVLTYLLLSASSSATFRVDDWESNWGKDKFPGMAKSSVVLSFLSFVAFALCSLLSGHTLFTTGYR